MSDGITLGHFVEQLVARDGALWAVAITETPGETAASIAGLLEDERPPGRLAEARSAADLERTLGESAGSTVVALAESLDANEWQRLDRARGRLEARGATRLVLVLSRAVEELAAREAPNLWSFFGSAAYAIVDEPALRDEDREARLEGLRRRHGLTDAELIEALGRGAAPREPDIAEWLVLLGRTDLLP